MIFGLAVAALLLVFIAVVLVPQRQTVTAGPHSARAGIDALKAQLAELDTDVAAGRVPEEGADAARLEIKRRLLRLAERDHVQKTVPAPGARTAGPVTLALMTLLSLGGAVALYLVLGAPGKPASPGARVTAAQQYLQPGGQTFAEVVDILEQRMAEVPDDPEPRRFLLQVSEGLRDYGRYARAALDLARIEPEEPQWRVAALTGFVQAGRGQMTPAARLVLDDFLHDFPDHPAARFHQARTLALDGDRVGARAILERLVADSPEDAPWLTDVRAALAELSSPDLSPQDQSRMVAAMVARLAERLEENPNDPEGWIRLARSRLVLGGPDDARTTLRTAIAADPSNRSRYEELLDRVDRTGNL